MQSKLSKQEKKRLKKLKNDAARAAIADINRKWWLKRPGIIPAPELTEDPKPVPQFQRKMKRTRTYVPVLYRDENLVLRPFISVHQTSDPE